VAKSNRTIRTEDEIRTETVSAALDAFFSGGYSQTTADTLARLVGVSKKTLYRIFTSKEGLMLIAARHVMRTIEQATDPCYHDHSRPVIERISALVEAITPHYAAIRSPDMLRDMRKNAPRVWEELETWRRGRYALFRSIIEDGVRSGELRTDIPVDDMQTFYGLLVNKVMDHHALEDSGVPPALLYRTFMDIFLHGLLVKGDPPCGPGHPTVFAPRDRILDVSERLFFANGYIGTTGDQITHELGMSKKTLYERFDSKESLAIALAVQAARDAREAARLLTFSNPSTYVHETHALMGIYASTVARFSPTYIADLAQYLPKLHRRMVRWQRSFLNEHIGRSLRAGMEAGVIRTDVDVTAAASIIRITAHHALAGSQPGTDLTPIAAEVACTILFSGIARHTERSPQPPTR
jgi:AcrR family transcriptional regulator